MYNQELTSLGHSMNELQASRPVWQHTGEFVFSIGLPECPVIAFPMFISSVIDPNVSHVKILIND